MNLEDLNKLDIHEVGIWPLPAKLGLILIGCAAIAFGGYYYHLADLWAGFEKVAQEEAGLRKDFETKQAKAANLPKYCQQYADMKEALVEMKKQLPKKTEVPALLVDVSQTGLAAGLEFKLFKPAGEAPLTFYAELPINLEVVGTYHQFGEFISGLAALPRIVTIHNINMAPIGGGKDPKTAGKLKLNAVAKTYRYLEEEDDVAAAQACKGKI